MAWTTVAAPIRTSPLANTPGRPVSKVTASAWRRRLRVAVRPSLPGPNQRRSGPWPMASRTRSQGMMNSVPAAGSGRRRPDASGSPSCIRMNSMPVVVPGLVLDHAGRAGLEDGGDTLLDGLVDLARRRHVLHVAAVDERHLAGALADRGADAVHRGEAAAHDHDPGADVARVGQAERGRAQVLQAVDDAVGVLVRDAQLVGVVAADGDDDAVEPLVLEVVEREVPAQLHVAAHLAAEARDRLVLGLEDLDLGQAVLRDAVAEHAAGGGVALEDRHVVAGQQQVVGGAHAGRAGADDRRAPAGRGLLLERQRRVDVLVEHRPQDLVARVAVAVADGDRLVHLVPAAVLLARGGAHAAEHAGERDRALEDAHRLAPARPPRSP